MSIRRYVTGRQAILNAVVSDMHGATMLQHAIDQAQWWAQVTHIVRKLQKNARLFKTARR